MAMACLGSAALVSAWLAGSSLLGQQVPGCAEGAMCQAVLSSKWAHLFGIPVSLVGFVLYGCLFALALARARSTHPVRRRLEGLGCVVVVLGALWFSCVQLFILHAFCPWCCSVHALASLGAVLLLGTRKRGSRDACIPARFAFLEWGAALLMVGALAFAQTSGVAPERIQTVRVAGEGVQRAGNLISVHEGRFTIDPANFPTIGSPESGRLLVALTDYTCPHCRELHETLSRLEEVMAGDVGVVLVPAYRDPGAEEMHRIMLTIWKEDAACFEELVAGMVSGQLPAEPAKVLELAQARQSGKVYQMAWNNAAWLDESLRLGRELLAANDSRLEVSTLPQLMVGGEVLLGVPRVETLVSLLGESPQPSGLAAAERPAPAPFSGSTGEPRIEFEQSRLELAEVTRGEEATGEFTYTNTGTAPLEILGIKSSCGCATVEGWKRTVAPGEKGSFKVVLDTSKVADAVTKSIGVTTNAANLEAGATNVLVTARVWTPVTLSTHSASFGVIPVGEEARPKQITITVKDGESLTIGQPACSNAYFETALEETEPGRQFVLTVSIPDLETRAESGEITIPLGNPRMPELKLPVYARVAERVEVNPKQLRLSAAPLESPLRRVLTVYCHDRSFREFEILSIEVVNAKGIEVTPKSSPSPFWRQIEVAILPGFDPKRAEEQKAAIVIETNHPEIGRIRVPVQVPDSGAVVSVGR